MKRKGSLHTCRLSQWWGHWERYLRWLRPYAKVTGEQTQSETVTASLWIETQGTTGLPSSGISSLTSSCGVCDWSVNGGLKTPVNGWQETAHTQCQHCIELFQSDRENLQISLIVTPSPSKRAAAFHKIGHTPFCWRKTHWSLKPLSLFPGV